MPTALPYHLMWSPHERSNLFLVGLNGASNSGDLRLYEYNEYNQKGTWGIRSVGAISEISLNQSPAYATLPSRHSYNRSCNLMTFSPDDSRYLAIGYERLRYDCSLLIWDIEQAKNINKFAESRAGIINSGWNDRNVHNNNEYGNMMMGYGNRGNGGVNARSHPQPLSPRPLPLSNSQWNRIEELKPLKSYGYNENVVSCSWIPLSPRLVAGMGTKYLKFYDTRQEVHTNLTYTKATYGVKVDPYNVHRIVSYEEGSLLASLEKDSNRIMLYNVQEQENTFKLSNNSHLSTTATSMNRNLSFNSIESINNTTTTAGLSEGTMTTLNKEDDFDTPILWKSRKNGGFERVFMDEAPQFSWEPRGNLTIFGNGGKDINGDNINLSPKDPSKKKFKTITIQPSKSRDELFVTIDRDNESSHDSETLKVMEEDISVVIRRRAKCQYFMNNAILTPKTPSLQPPPISQSPLSEKIDMIDYSDEIPTVPTTKLAQRKLALTAGWALFHRETERAIEALNNSRDEKLKLVSTALAGFSFNKNQDNPLWREMCKQLSFEMREPYLRAIFSYISSGNWDNVLNDEELELRDRVGIAVRFMDDEKDPRVDQWVESYRSLLDKWEMFHIRAQFDILRGKLMDTSAADIAPPQVYVRCDKCSQSIAHNLFIPVKGKSIGVLTGSYAVNGGGFARPKKRYFNESWRI
ncbi:1673_t:CDS:10 [Diversispora eburnea]|uniref:1673_t:CDS:1 n=1 Tax=Diversispora eburnea TaxID=1213867 RepID=A0A9N8W2P3_9GLOM|nr:1673_t:CDS:10 [Diversispora eburnea]